MPKGNFKLCSNCDHPKGTHPIQAGLFCTGNLDCGCSDYKFVPKSTSEQSVEDTPPGEVFSQTKEKERPRRIQELRCECPAESIDHVAHSCQYESKYEVYNPHTKKLLKLCMDCMMSNFYYEVREF